MQLEMIILSEVSQKEKDKYHMLSLICGIQNMMQMNLSMQQKQSHGYREQTPWIHPGVAGVGGEGETNT